MTIYKIITIHTENPKYNRYEIVNRPDLIKIFPFMLHIISFNKLILTTDSIKYEITRIP